MRWIPSWLRRSSAALAALLHILSCAPTLPLVEERCKGIAGDLVVTEVLSDPAGEDTGKEYVEIFNATSSDLNLEGFSLVHAGTEGSGERKIVLPNATIPAGGYFVLGDARVDPKPAHIDYSYDSRLGALRNDAGRISVRCGNRIIDEIAYAGVTMGHARELDGALVPDSAANDNLDNWCTSQNPLDELAPAGDNFGTPGAPNTTCAAATVKSCKDRETGVLRALVPPEEDDLVISEVMANPAAASDTDGEWIELYAHKPVDLNDVTVRSGSGSLAIVSESCVSIAPGQYAVLARNDDPNANGGLPPLTATLALSLPNGASFVSLESAGTVIDEANWTSALEGSALQLSSNALSAPRDQRLPAFCQATQPYGRGDRGSPGSPNETCPVVVQPGQCLDATTGAARAIQTPKPSDLLITEIMAHTGSVPDAAGEWFEVLARSSVDLNGVELGNEGSGTTKLSATECLRAEAGSHLLFARNAEPAMNGGLPEVHAIFGFALGNTGTRAVVLTSDAVLIDRAEYSGATRGISLQLSPDVFEPSVRGNPAAWCTTPPAHTYGLGDRGTPGARNMLCGGMTGDAGAATDGATGADSGSSDGGNSTEQCLDPNKGVLRDPIRPAPGELFVTEIMAAPAVGNGGSGEWFELFAKANFDLNDLVLANESGGSVRLSHPSCLAVAAGEWVLFARSDDPKQNGGLPPVRSLFDFGLSDSGSSAYPERAVILKLGHAELHRGTWAKSAKGVSLQLSADALSSAEGTPTAWCPAPIDAAFGAGERGTPGAANLRCP